MLSADMKHGYASLEHGDEAIIKPHMSDESVEKTSSVAAEETDVGYDVTNINQNNASNNQFQEMLIAEAFLKEDEMPYEISKFSETYDCEVYFKMEYLHESRSFHERSMRHIMSSLTDEQLASGLVTAADGNLAISFAYQGQQLGINITLVMTLSNHFTKLDKCKNYGADVIVRGGTIEEAKTYAVELAKEKGCHYIDCFDHPLAIIANGLIGFEIVRQIPDVDAIVVPVGSGVLIAGISLAVKTYKPNVRIIGVESESCPNLAMALEVGRPIQIKPRSSIARELSYPEIGRNSFNTCVPLIDRVIVSREDSIALAILRMSEIEKLAVEGSAACGIAALMDGELRELKGKKIVILLADGNICPDFFLMCMKRGMAVDGRLLRVTVTVEDTEGGTKGLLEMVTQLGVKVHKVSNKNCCMNDSIFTAKVVMECEVHQKQHAIKLEEDLKERYSEVTIMSKYEVDD